MVLKVKEYLAKPYSTETMPSKTADELEKINKSYTELVQKIKYIAYRLRDRFIYHIIIPSSKGTSQTYDIILEFVSKNQTDKSNTLLDEIPVKVFSNCPSFIFSQLVSFYNCDLISLWCIDKYNETTKSKLPQTKSKSTDIGLERSVYIAMKYFMEHGLYKNTQTALYKSAVSDRTILNKIRTQDEIMQGTKSDTDTAKKAKTEEKSKTKKSVAPSNRILSTKESNITKNTLSSKSTSNSTKTKNMRRVKKI